MRTPKSFVSWILLLCVLGWNAVAQDVPAVSISESLNADMKEAGATKAAKVMNHTCMGDLSISLIDDGRPQAILGIFSRKTGVPGGSISRYVFDVPREKAEVIFDEIRSIQKNVIRKVSSNKSYDGSIEITIEFCSSDVQKNLSAIGPDADSKIEKIHGMFHNLLEQQGEYEKINALK